MILTTPRLRLVPPEARHIPAYAAFLASPRAAARGWQAMPHEAWRHFAAILGHGLLRGFGPLVAEDRESGRALGLFGPWWPEGQPEREVKWTLFETSDEGRGLAAEAARACLGHVFGTLGWTGAVSYITPDNARSAALALRLGAVQDGTWTTPRGTLVQVFRHQPPLPSSPTRGEAGLEGQPVAPGQPYRAPFGVGGQSVAQGHPPLPSSPTRGEAGLEGQPVAQPYHAPSRGGVGGSATKGKVSGKGGPA